MKRSYDSAMNELRDLVDALGRFDLDDDAIEARGAVLECLRLGLPLIEEKYGLSSDEAAAVRSTIAENE
ncbi:MAG: hypothetical protein JST38_17085 [Bacteroidetes bacterium]|nr:hypothetical protein [Bacteroidota bacterium]